MGYASSGFFLSLLGLCGPIQDPNIKLKGQFCMLYYYFISSE